MHAQLSGAGSSQPQQPTTHSVYQELVCLFRGTDFNSAAVIHGKLIALNCAPFCVHDYVSRWHSGLNHLSSAGHLFNHVDSLCHFVNYLPFGSTYDIIWESVLFSLNTASAVDQLPPFELVVECIMNVNLN